MSPAKLRYSFKNIYRVTLQQYIVTKRIAQAERLLRDSEISVAQAAEIVGYRRAGSLSEMFKKQIGMTPVEYRKVMRTT